MIKYVVVLQWIKSAMIPNPGPDLYLTKEYIAGPNRYAWVQLDDWSKNINEGIRYTDKAKAEQQARLLTAKCSGMTTGYTVEEVNEIKKIKEVS